MKALAYGRVIGGHVLCGRGTSAKALVCSRVLGRGFLYGRGTPAKALAYGRVRGGFVSMGELPLRRHLLMVVS